MTAPLAVVVALAVSVGSGLLAGCGPDPLRARQETAARSEVRLVSDVASVRPGEPFTVGLHVTLDEGWRTPWKNAGDVGNGLLATWTLPGGFIADSFAYPIPERISDPPVASYGYHDEVVFLATMTPPADIETGRSVRFTLSADFVICGQTCIPGHAERSLELPVRDAPPTASDDAALIRRYADRLPVENAEWTMRAARTDGGFFLGVAPQADWEGSLDGAYFFPADPGLVDHAADQPVARTAAGEYRVRLTESAYLAGEPKRIEGVLVLPDGGAFDVSGHRGLVVSAEVTTLLTSKIILETLDLVAALESAPTGNDAREMSDAAEAFLASLSPDQRAMARFSFGDDERLNWHFIPRERRGLPFRDMDERQRELVRALFRTGLSPRGIRKVDDIISLELVLRELGGNPAVRNPELYFVSIFGDPSGSRPWGWRFEGHHLSLNYTVIDGVPVSWAPAFMGADPAEVRQGPRTGLRPLASEEDLARALVRSLDDAQRRQAVVNVKAPSDILTRNAREVDPLEPTGISITDLRPRQVDQLVRLLDEYLGRMSDDLAASRRVRIEASDVSRIAFAWAGSLEVGEPHYYRIQGPSFLVEYDNTQNGADHIHSVWRDFDGDFGRDLLRDHYDAHPHHH